MTGLERSSSSSSPSVRLVGHEREGHDGGAHAPEVGVAVALRCGAVVGPLDGLDERRRSVGSWYATCERLDGEPRGDLAALVAAHAVGDGEQAAVGARATKASWLSCGPGRRRWRRPSAGERAARS